MPLLSKLKTIFSHPRARHQIRHPGKDKGGWTLILVLSWALPGQLMEGITLASKLNPLSKPWGISPFSTKRRAKLTFSLTGLLKDSSIPWKEKRESTEPLRSKRMTHSYSTLTMKFSLLSMLFWVKLWKLPGWNFVNKINCRKKKKRRRNMKGRDMLAWLRPRNWRQIKPGWDRSLTVVSYSIERPTSRNAQPRKKW